MSDKQKRRRWASSEKLRVVLAGLDGSVEVSELCRRKGINPTQYYGWATRSPCTNNGAESWPKGGIGGERRT
ncbi:MAG: transposase [Pirellulales bacterium]|nr:transposase [Pirellulales bacterium]